jgi:hypothetical protein
MGEGQARLMVRFRKTTDKTCCQCDRYFAYQQVVADIGLLCNKCLSDSLPGLASLFQAMLDIGGSHEWVTAGDHADAFAKMSNTLAGATGLNETWVARYLDVRGELYKHTGPEPHQTDYVGHLPRLWLDIPHVERSLEVVLDYPQPFGSVDPWNLDREPLDLGEGARVEHVFTQVVGVGTIVDRHGPEWVLVDWGKSRSWEPARTLRSAEPRPREASEIIRASALLDLRSRLLSLPGHAEGYQFHSFTPRQAHELLDVVPLGLTPPHWKELYSRLVRNGIVQRRAGDYVIDLESLVGLAESLQELHKQKLLAHLPAPKKCADALRVFARRVGEHMVVPEGTAWVSRVAIPVTREVLVLVTPEVIVTDEEWTAILHLIDDRGIWVGVAGQGFEVDRDKLHKLIEEVAGESSNDDIATMSPNGPQAEYVAVCTPARLFARLRAMFVASEFYGPRPADILRARAMVGLAQTAGADCEKRRKVADYTHVQHRDHLGTRAEQHELCETIWNNLLNELGDWHDCTDDNVMAALHEQLSILVQCPPEAEVDEALVPESLSTWVRQPVLGKK